MPLIKYHNVEVLRDTHRVEGPYAKQGVTGKVLRVFQSYPGSAGLTRWNVLVLMGGGGVRTFRISSAKKVQEKITPT